MWVTVVAGLWNRWLVMEIDDWVVGIGGWVVGCDGRMVHLVMKRLCFLGHHLELLRLLLREATGVNRVRVLARSSSISNFSDLICFLLLLFLESM